MHGKLATVYAAGCFAIRFKLLPFNFAELLGAVLTCERDHVAFVAKELGEAVASAGNPIAAAKSSPYARLKAYVFGPARKKFIDLREPARACRRGISTTALPATWASYGGNKVIWLPYVCFAQIAVIDATGRRSMWNSGS